MLHQSFSGFAITSFLKFVFPYTNVFFLVFFLCRLYSLIKDEDFRLRIVLVQMQQEGLCLDFPGFKQFYRSLFHEQMTAALWFGSVLLLKVYWFGGYRFYCYFSCVPVRTWNQLRLFWAVRAAAPWDKIPCQERGQAVQLCYTSPAVQGACF